MVGSTAAGSAGTQDNRACDAFILASLRDDVGGYRKSKNEMRAEVISTSDGTAKLLLSLLKLLSKRETKASNIRAAMSGPTNENCP